MRRLARLTLALAIFALLACGCRPRSGIGSVHDLVFPPPPEAPAPPAAPGRAPIVCECAAAQGDADGDCEPDAVEAGFTDASSPDTDGDGILDGCEDRNHNGSVDRWEQDPSSADSDHDGLADGLEDRNHNGVWDQDADGTDETDATNADTDSDGLPDGIEDRNHNGVWDCGSADAPLLPPCETDPRSHDTDRDGLTDPTELKTFLDPGNPQFDFVPGFGGRDPADPDDDQTCPWNADSDGDGLDDGAEDPNADGFVSSLESDPRLADTDRDGLLDGREDQNLDGFYDPLFETHPALIDSDADGLNDGLEDSGGCLTIILNDADACSGEPSTGTVPCECAFWRDGLRQDRESDPRLADSDDDGLPDAAEDRNGDGVCQRAKPRDLPRASDESCAYLGDSDGDNLTDGFEDKNYNGRIDAGETDPRRADPDNDCLDDSSEIGVGTDPFVADSDGDGLADGLETFERLRFDGAGCVPLDCPGSRPYQTSTCPNPLIADTDGDGYADGFQVLNGVVTGEDEDADGCAAAGESDPCFADVPVAPAPGDGLCTMPSCTGADLCSLGGCPAAEKQSQALVCAGGNLRPVLVVRSEANDYALALPAKPGAIGGVPEPLFSVGELVQGGAVVGSAFHSDTVAGTIMRLGTLQLAESGCSAVIDVPPILDNILALPVASSCPPAENYLVWSPALRPTDVAERAARRITARLLAQGYLLERTAGGLALGQDDETAFHPNGTSVTITTDTYVIRKPGEVIDATEISRAVSSALAGGATFKDPLPAPNVALGGAVVELHIEFYRRLVKKRGSLGGALVSIAEYGALVAATALADDCSRYSGQERLTCRKSVEGGVIAVADLTNGSALTRFQAEIDQGCDNFAPSKAKADFLLGIDDSGSMQEFIIAVEKAVRNVAFKLQANNENMDWRLAMTTSSFGQGDDAGPRNDLTPLAMPDPFTPGFDGQAPASDHGYPKLAPASATPEPVFFGYQSTAFDQSGVPQRCVYAEAFDPGDPLKSPYCCDLAAPGDAEFLFRCCSLSQAAPVPATYGSGFSLADQDGQGFAGPVFADASNWGASDAWKNDTLRCFDVPRFGDEPSKAWSYVPYYPTADPNAADATIDTDSNLTTRHFLDYLCGAWQLDRNGQGVYALSSFSPTKLWGTRGHLWPPGFVGADTSVPPNPRKDGANLLIRNADMLVTQMNRLCYKHATNRSLMLPAPREFHQGGAEQLLQAVKRAIQRATASGRGNDPYRLRADAPLIALLVSDEEDFSHKFRDDSSARPSQAFLAGRDYNALPAARCLANGDAGCTLEYCQDTCFGAWVDQGDPAVRIPSARTYSAASKTIVRDSKSGAYCIAPESLAPIVDGDCSGGAFCATSSTRYDGFHSVLAGEDPNSDATVADRASGANSRSRDALNVGHTVPATCDSVCGDDCLPCARFLREKQYVDFLTGQCSPPDGSALDPSDVRRYPPPTAQIAGGDRVLPLGLTYAITRREGQQGGEAGSCGSAYPGGDGQAFRDVALQSGGRVADICLASSAGGFSEFLDQILVDAQGLGSPYRLSARPISSTLKVGVLGKDGVFRMIRRSTVAGFDYNPMARSIAFFAESPSDTYNAVSKERDARVFISYRVWKRTCGEDCPLGDACSICTCGAATPECCTPTPTFICQALTPCPQGCGPCEACDPATDSCKPADLCGQSCGAAACTKNGCSTCPSGTLVDMPCVAGGGGVCPAQPLSVCVSQEGVPNPGGAACVVSGAGQPNQDCCGAQKACDPGEVCVLEACTGGGCLPSARCHTLGDPSFGQDQWCGACPLGTMCAPVPCATEPCPPAFRCVADNPGSTATCAIGPECGCPNDVCSDCPVGQYCDVNRKCLSLCAASVAVEACCTDAANRVVTLGCCPSGEHFDRATSTCQPGIICDPACPEDFFCDPRSGLCLPRGE